MLKKVLYFWYGQALFIGQATDAAAHRHHALQVGIGLNQPFGLTLEGRPRRCRTAIISPDQPHQLKGRGDWQAIILLDPETDPARQLTAKYLAKSKAALTDQSLPAEAFDRIRLFISKPGGCREAAELCAYLLDALTDGPAPRKKYHQKVKELIQYLDELPVKKISLAEIANNVHLSQSRIVHLFKEQVGIPIRRYLLWLRLMQAVSAVMEGLAFTTAAHQTGFADSAHLSRTFRSMFGLTLSDLFKNSQFVQAVSCRRPYSQV